MSFTELIKNNKKEIIFSLALIIYIISAILIFKQDPYKIISNYGGLSIFLALLGGFLLLMTLFFIKRKKEIFKTSRDTPDDGPSALQFLLKLVSVIATFGLIVGVIIAVIYICSHLTTTTSIILYVLNMAIIAGLIAFAIKYFGIGQVTEDKASWSGLIKKMIFYVPCLIVDLAEFIKNEYNITPKSVWIILGFEILLIALRFLIPLLFKKVINHDGNHLLKDPIFLSKEKNLATFQELNKKSKKDYSYNYSLSSWIYINPQPPSTSSAYEDYTSLLNLGNKPNILYNGRTNTLMIKMKTSPNKETIIYKTKDIKYQKWNNFVINYDGGTLDIFINNNLVASVPGIIPYMGFDNITSGASPGIDGGICGVVYFNKTLTRDKISWLYNSTKELNPPVL